MQKEIKNLQFKAKPKHINVTTGMHQPNNVELTLGGCGLRDSSFNLHVTKDELEYLLGDNTINVMNNEFIVTIEKVVCEPKAHELLQAAANNAKVGFTKKAIEQVVKALEKLSESK